MKLFDPFFEIYLDKKYGGVVMLSKISVVNPRLYRLAEKCDSFSPTIFKNREVLGMVNLTAPAEVCLALESIIGSTLTFRLSPFASFITDKEQFDIGPEYFDLILGENPSRYLLLKCKQLALEVRHFINSSLSAETKKLIFKEKFVNAGIDNHLKAFFGLEKSFFEGGGELLTVEYLADTIDYRFPRDIKIPHFVYRVTVRLPKGETKVVYIKKVHKNKNEEVFAKACYLENLQSTVPSYFEGEGVGVWMISEEINSRKTLKDVMSGNIYFTPEEKKNILFSLAGFAALSDVYSRGARLLGNYPVSLLGERGVATVDSEFLFNEKDFIISDAYKGSHELFFANVFPILEDVEKTSHLLCGWESSYLTKFREILEKRDAHIALINDYKKELPVNWNIAPSLLKRVQTDKSFGKNIGTPLSDKALEVFERQIKLSPYARLDEVYRALMLWRIKNVYMDQWENLSSLHSRRIVFAFAPDKNNKVLDILESAALDRNGKLRELSCSWELTELFFELVDQLTYKLMPTKKALAFSRNIEVLNKKQDEIMKKIRAKREERTRSLVAQFSSVEEILQLTTMIYATPVIADDIVGKLISFSSNEKELSLDLFTKNLILVVNASSPALRKELRRSAKIVDVLFGVKVPDRTNSIFFDHKTLVLKKALDKYIQDGAKVLEIGPGCTATLGVYLSKGKRKILVAGAEINTDFVKTANASIKLNGANMVMYESDIVSCEQLVYSWEYDLAFWNIPFVTSNAKHIDEITPGIFDSVKPFATEKDDGTNLIKRFLKEIPVVLKRDGIAIFASNTFYVPLEKIRLMIAGSSFDLIEEVKQEGNTSVAFVLRKR